ncbi:MAG: hypothetical protein ACTHJT_08700 [Cytophaga sp.]|uniref:hypothetical protein n=1 Tax=Cytophaga sp. TaxID=29535 RepID=UPI003F7E1551
MEINTADHQKKEVVILLLADMRNTRLVHGLNAVGLKTDTFYTCLTDLVLYKMGFRNYTDEALAVWYKDLLYQTIDREQMEYAYHERQLAEELYKQLVLKREMLQGSEIATDTLWYKLKKWMQI